MSVTVESTTVSNWATGSTTFTQSKPTGTTDGDFLVAVVFTGADNGSTALSVSGVPSGWNLVNNTISTTIDGSNNPVSVYTYYKVASSDGNTWDWTLNTSGANLFYAGCVFRLSGTDTIDSYDNGTGANDDTPAFTGGVTPLGTNGLLIMATVITDVATAGTSTSGYAVTTDNPTWTELMDDSGGEGVGSAIHCSVAYAIRTASTATGGWTLSVAGTGAADTASQLLSIPSVTNISVSTTAGEAAITTIVPTLTGDSNSTATINEGAISIHTPSITTPVEDWTNQTKNTGSWVNQSKS